MVGPFRMVVIESGSRNTSMARIFAHMEVEGMLIVIADAQSHNTCPTGELPIFSDIQTIFASLDKKSCDYYEDDSRMPVNGNLHYCYKKPLDRPTFTCRRFQIQQPCWSRNRWKSLT